MDITPLGLSSFRIRGKGAVVVTDPFDTATVGLKYPRGVEADIVTVSHDHSDHNAITNVTGTPYVVKGPGEYEIKGVIIEGIPTFHDDSKGEVRGRNTMYHFLIDGINILHMGDLGHMLTAAEIEKLGNVDILLLPVGGHYTVDAKTASELIGEIEPTIVIPMHYGRPALNQQIFGQLTGVDIFLKEMGKETVTPVPKLSVTKDKLPEELQVVVLE